MEEGRHFDLHIVGTQMYVDFYFLTVGNSAALNMDVQVASSFECIPTIIIGYDNSILIFGAMSTLIQ